MSYTFGRELLVAIGILVENTRQSSTLAFGGLNLERHTCTLASGRVNSDGWWAKRENENFICTDRYAHLHFLIKQ